MKVQDVSIDKIKPYENNPRDNENAVGGVAQSIQEFDWQQPIVVDKNYVIIVGHTRYKAAKQLGMKVVPVTVADKLTPEQVRAYRLADNKTADFSIWDNKKLLEELSIIPDNLFTGFDPSDVFEDVLDETDTSPLDETEQGIVYTINYKTQNKELYDKIKSFIAEEDENAKDTNS